MPLTRPALACCLLLLTCPAAMAQQSYGVPSEGELNQHELTRAWWAQAHLNPSRDTVRHLVADEEVVCVQSSAGLVTTFEAETGKELWKAQLGGRDNASFPAITNGDLVLIAAGMNIFAVTKYEGDIVWKLNVPGHPSAAPAIDDDQLFIPTLDGSIYAYSLRRIARLYNEGKLPQWSAQTLQWRFFTGKRISVPPVSNGRVVSFANDSESLYTISAADRGVIFQFRSDKPASAPITTLGDAIYMVTADFRVYSINMQTGGLRWAPFPLGLPIREQPLAIGTHLYITPVRGGLFTLSTENGKQTWPWRPGVKRVLAASDRFLFASDNLDNLLILDRSHSGETIATLPYRDYSVRISNSKTDRLYLSTPSGRVICIRDRQLDAPLYHQDPDRRPLMPEFEKEAGAADDAAAAGQPTPPPANDN